ncbi:MAG: hypothetical protein A2Y86_02680 [Candidatus Aminicenantes bacterium RBG_13_62_12]|nr:MAG: hypothetical protein A2Y86_02680 [Candidatus Aminicenantes bacterium RBG_13_62_12]
MSCPAPVLLEDYAEGLLAAREAQAVETHLRGCDACRRALEERILWLNAFRSLPPLELPSGFARRVMAAAFPRPRGRLLRPAAAAAGLASLVLTAVILVAAGACDVPAMMVRSGRLLWRGFQAGASFCAKAVRLALALFKAVAQLLQLVWDAIESLTRAASPQLQVLALASFFILACFSLFGYRKLFVRR